MSQVRALQNDAAEVPVCVSSVASSASPRSGSSRVHPYNPVGEAVEGSSFEVVPSIANRAASASGFDESVEVTPIRRSNSSPVVFGNPMQVMNPNLVAGMASGSTQAPGEHDMDLTTARAILQQWSEVKNEDGTVARTYTRCAKTWLSAEKAAFDNIDNEIASQTQSTKANMTENASRLHELSTRLDGMMERISAAHGRLEAMGVQLEREGSAQRSAIVELRKSTSQCQRDVNKVTECLTLVQVDSQMIDQELTDLRENVLHKTVELECGFENCQRQITHLQRPVEGQISAEVYQEHARGTDQASEQCASGPEVTQRLLWLEDELRNQQRAYDRLREDSVGGCTGDQVLPRPGHQVREMAMSLCQRSQEPQSSTSAATRPQLTRLMTAAQRGDVKVEV